MCLHRFAELGLSGELLLAYEGMCVAIRWKSVPELQGIHLFFQFAMLFLKRGYCAPFRLRPAGYGGQAGAAPPEPAAPGQPALACPYGDQSVSIKSQMNRIFGKEVCNDLNDV